MRRTILLILAVVLTVSTVSAQEDKGKKKEKKQTVTDTVSRENEDESDSYGVSEEPDDSDFGGGNFVPSLLHSNTDVFTNNTSYTFSIAYFRARGYDNRYQNTYANGFEMWSLVNGRSNFSQWGGLNNIFRYPENVSNLNAAAFGFGDIGGASNYNLRASNFRKQLRVSYSTANRTYNNRLMLTYSTGLLPNGWAVTASASARFGNYMAYVDGTSFNGFAGFIAAEKKINNDHWLNISAFTSYRQRGMQSSSVQEAYDLLGNNYYNANWGWYNGKKRNARIGTLCEPVILLTHTYAPENNRLHVSTALATTFGRNNSTSLNWYDAPDPRPDYYRYLPSYQIDNGDTAGVYQSIVDLWTNNDQSYTQVNWDNLYNVNQLAAQQGKRAQYMIENRTLDHIQAGGATNLTWNISDNWKLYAGASLRGIKQRNYKTIADLLGGSYWLDVDKFSEGDFPDDMNVQYNDLLHKDDTLTEGDVFGYDFDYHIYNEKVWAMAKATYNHVDFHIGGLIGGTEFYRDGKMQNGRFKDESLGKSATKSFLELGAKAGITYKINGRNYLVLNTMAERKAPSVLNSFTAPRIHNKYVDNLTTEKIYSGDLSYVLSYPIVKMRVSAFLTQINDATKLVSFYHDDYASMVNYSISGIAQRHWGFEVGAEVKLGTMFTLIMAGTWGDYRYSDRATVTMNAENGTDFEGEVNRTVYWKNFHVAGTPQAAATLGLKFNHKYWWVTVNANYFDKIYCDLNPERRTSTARGSLDENSELYHQVVDQIRLKGQFTIDLSVSKSWRIKGHILGLNASVTNLLNNKKLVTTAWEQYRFDYTNYNVNKFANKYYYAYGTTFYLGINFSL
ncbi:MAG: hypothetical protein SPL42_00705 [Bacteroidales bacterium]|nr:hypothetical protein [Bacteroidales bacterium]